MTPQPETPRDLPRDDDVRRWALAEIGAAPAASSPEQAKVEALRFVRRFDFAPSLTEALAIGILLNRSRRPVETFAHEAAYSVHEDSYCRAVEEFARNYFQLAPLERRRRWEGLMGATVLYPWWQPRLERLQTGLDVMLTGDPATRELAAEIAGLFTLPPGAQAAQRRTLFDRLRKTRNSKDLIRQLKHTEPGLTKLMRDDLDLIWGPSSGWRLWSLTVVLVVLALSWFAMSLVPMQRFPRPTQNSVPKKHDPMGDAVKQLQRGELDGHWGDATKRLLEGLPVDAMGKKWVLVRGYLEPNGWEKPADWSHPDLEKNARWFRPK